MMKTKPTIMANMTSIKMGLYLLLKENVEIYFAAYFFWLILQHY